jgi:hypothetical protein
MPAQMYFFVSIAFSFVTWGVVAARYIWPALRIRPRDEALRPLLMVHSFRFIGLAFLVPGVVSPDPAPAFAHSAAYGDIVATILALLSLSLLPSAAGTVLVWLLLITYGLVFRIMLQDRRISAADETSTWKLPLPH